MKFFVVTLIIMAAGCASKTGKPIEDAGVPPVSDLPAVTLIESNGRQFSAQTLGGNTILIFFSTSCDHCQREATNIRQSLKSFENYTLYFIAMDSFPVIHQFAREYRIDNQSNIKFMRADAATVTGSLGAIQTPTILVYSRERKLLRRFDGETDVKEITKIL